VIRAFIAIDLDPRVSEKLCQAIGELKQLLPAVRWVSPQNFHLTLKFLGDIDESRVETIGVALVEALCPFSRLSINAKGLGVFPDLRRPRVLWVGLAGNGLMALAARVESALEPLGFASEQRPFTPHMTIGRWRQYDRAPKSLGEALAGWRNREFGESTVDKVVFYQSVLKPEGAIYHTLRVVALEGKGRGLKRTRTLKEAGDGCEPREGD
jgi:2'-5' RNA ligase